MGSFTFQIQDDKRWADLSRVLRNDIPFTQWHVGYADWRVKKGGWGATMTAARCNDAERT